MPKLSLQYVCSECGATSQKWMGRCPSCGRWQTLQEEVSAAETKPEKIARASLSGSAKPQKLEEVSGEDAKRLGTGIPELDRVLGGGLVPGSLVLLSGDPGIGKSTLVLQACRHMANAGLKVLYCSGEESAAQVALRAKRLGPFKGEFLLLAETRWENLLAQVEREKPKVLVVDSIQTLATDELPSSAGSVTQVREIAARLMEACKSRGLAAFLVGHVTKDGALAGPKTLEHMVDVVLNFEGEKHHPVRMVRASKNRFGSTQELGLFEMSSEGLVEVTAASEYFLKSRMPGLAGSAAYVHLEGSRPVLAEIQSLVTITHFGTPQRSSTGFDPWRLSLLYAVLEKRCGVNLYNQDVFVSAAGGLRIDDPAADLAVALAVVSSLRSRAIPDTWVAFGEIGLGGELRPVASTEARLREARRMGFKRAVVARMDPKEMERLKSTGIELRPCRMLEEALAELENA